MELINDQEVYPYHSMLHMINILFDIKIKVYSGSDLQEPIITFEDNTDSGANLEKTLSLYESGADGKKWYDLIKTHDTNWFAPDDQIKCIFLYLVYYDLMLKDKDGNIIQNAPNSNL